MEHISDFTIHSFRGLRDLKIEKLGQINLLVGNNNSGKTSVLEATSIFCNPFDLFNWYNIGYEREGILGTRSTNVDRLVWMFPQKIDDNGTDSENAQIHLSIEGNTPVKEVTASYERFTEVVIPGLILETDDMTHSEGKGRKVEAVRLNISILGTYARVVLPDDDFSFRKEATILLSNSPRGGSASVGDEQPPSLPIQAINPLSHRTEDLTLELWSEVVEADLKSETINLLQFFDSAIEDVDFIAPAENRQLISIKHKKLGRAPLYTFGDGLRRVFTLATTIPRVRDGILLIDELETAIHTKALEKTFNWLVNACIRNNVQLIATTHSLEALDALLDASIDERASLVVYRLQQEQQQTTATRFDKEMTRRLREDLGMELRY